MKPRELFGVAVRVIGLLAAANGLSHIINSGLGPLGYFTTQRTAYSFYLIEGIIQLVAGLYLLRGAPFLIRFAYPERLGKTSGTVSDQSDEPSEDR